MLDAAETCMLAATGDVLFKPDYLLPDGEHDQF